MRKSFYIKELRSINKLGQVSKISFKNGLNIIHGPSNTGKSLVIQCLNYMFGAKKLDGLTNQVKLEMDIDHEDGFLTLSRTINEKQTEVLVSSTIPYIESKTYTTKYENGLSRVYLKLLGIYDFPIKVIRNSEFITNNLTWKSLTHMFLLDETEMIRKNSIILPKINTSNTYFLSSLIYLITGNDQSTMEQQDTSLNKKIRREAVIDYINLKLQKISEYQKDFSKEILKIEESEVERRLDSALENLAVTRTQLKDITIKNENILKANHLLTSEKEENSISIKNFSNLLNQYQIDLKRLTLIIEGDSLIHEHSKETPCPFCNSIVENSTNEVTTEEVIREIEVIQSKIIEINNTINSLGERNHSIESLINTNNIELDSNLNHINTFLQPKIELLKGTIKEYNIYFNFKTEQNLIKNLSEEWNEDITTIDSENDEKLEYKPKDRFPSNFYSDMNKILNDILEKCSFPNMSSVHIDKSTFDVVVNGKSKALEGKGYRAYLNTVLALAIREYLFKFGKYYIPIFITDTPLLGLDELTESGLNNMRESLHKYFYDASSKGQIIVADNDKDLPKIDYSGMDINSIEFTKSEEHGRYGFLMDMKD